MFWQQIRSIWESKLGVSRAQAGTGEKLLMRQKKTKQNRDSGKRVGKRKSSR